MRLIVVILVMAFLGCLNLLAVLLLLVIGFAYLIPEE
jgi:hypothetical protein